MHVFIVLEDSNYLRYIYIVMFNFAKRVINILEYDLISMKNWFLTCLNNRTANGKSKPIHLCKQKKMCAHLEYLHNHI